MSRLSDAWAALCGRPRVVEKTVEIEKSVEVEKPVPVGDGAVTVYVAAYRKYRADLERYYAALRTISYLSLTRAIPPRPNPPEWVGRVYLTCAQAFAECGEDVDLTQRKALIHDGSAYLFDNLTKHPLQPKPKRAKGAKA